MSTTGERRSASAAALRRSFFRGLWRGLGVIWPIFSGLLLVMVLLGLGVAVVEGWPLTNGVYFAFVSGLTIGYGDLVPKLTLARFLAMLIGVTGVLLAGLIVAVGVHALQAALAEGRANS